MTHPLQDKDDHWRPRGNGAQPIFDPGVVPAGVEEEAGGARAAVPGPAVAKAPLPTDPVSGGRAQD